MGKGSNSSTACFRLLPPGICVCTEAHAATTIKSAVLWPYALVYNKLIPFLGLPFAVKWFEWGKNAVHMGGRGEESANQTNKNKNKKPGKTFRRFVSAFNSEFGNFGRFLGRMIF